MAAQRDGYGFGAVGGSGIREYRPDVLIHRVKENAKLEIVEIAGTHPTRAVNLQILRLSLSATEVYDNSVTQLVR
jgi:hypothetical protein